MVLESFFLLTLTISCYNKPLKHATREHAFIIMQNILLFQKSSNFSCQKNINPTVGILHQLQSRNSKEKLEIRTYTDQHTKFVFEVRSNLDLRPRELPWRNLFCTISKKRVCIQPFLQSRSTITAEELSQENDRKQPKSSLNSHPENSPNPHNISLCFIHSIFFL